MPIGREVPATAFAGVSRGLLRQWGVVRWRRKPGDGQRQQQSQRQGFHLVLTELRETELSIYIDIKLLRTSAISEAGTGGFSGMGRCALPWLRAVLDFWDGAAWVDGA